MYFTASLVLSLIVLCTMNVAVRRQARRISGSVACVILVLTVPMYLLMTPYFPPVFFSSVALLIVFVPWQKYKLSPTKFHFISPLIVVVVFLIQSWRAWESLEDYRRQFPIVAMEKLVAEPARFAPRAALAEPTEKELVEMDNAVESERSTYRELTFRELHERAVAAFMDSSGFGVGRMPSTEDRLGRGLYSRAPILQPKEYRPAPWSPGEIELVKRPSDQQRFVDLWRNSSVNFVYPRGFGYVQDRSYATGYLSHGYREPALSEYEAKSFDLVRLDLISLLLHDEPVVYVSDQLPNMKEARDLPTRGLDTFESFGLATLQRGEDLVILPDKDEFRMAGSLRNGKQCIKCHGGERGDLLGVLVYVLKERK